MSVVALDLGSTRLKCARFSDEGTVVEQADAPAAEITGLDPVCESDPTEMLRRASRLLACNLHDAPPRTRIALATQRSSFLLWERRSGRPVTPLISWRDRRADAWCHTRAGRAAGIAARTGLLLSPHYAAPKLSCLFAEEPALHRRAEHGELLFGTLETFLIWSWSARAAHLTDLSMAARTLLADPVRRVWCPQLLAEFGVPAGCLPEIVPSTDLAIPLPELPGRPELAVTVADQSAALIALAPSADAAAVNLGTGGFVLRDTAGEFRPVRRYLAGPVLWRRADGARYFAEGTVNSPSALLRGKRPPAVSSKTAGRSGVAGRSEVELHCLPDGRGIGAPFWLADTPPIVSSPVAGLAPAELRGAVLAGLAHRVAQILGDLFPMGQLRRVHLSGGVAREPGLAALIANASGVPVSLGAQREQTLLGAAQLAGVPPGPSEPASLVVPRDVAAASARFRRWLAWAEAAVDELRSRAG